jgi:hypothetical protein
MPTGEVVNCAGCLFRRSALPKPQPRAGHCIFDLLPDELRLTEHKYLIDLNHADLLMRYADPAPLKR